MGLKSKLFGLGSALSLGLILVGPAAATTTSVGTVPVSVTVNDAGGTLGLGILSSTGFAFNPVTLNAAESGTGGKKSAGDAALDLQITNDVALVNTPFDVTIRLDDGSGDGAYLKPTGPVPSFEAGANVQIPGRYLSVTAVSNPAQAKFSGGANSGCTVWDGTGAVGSPQCAPREAVPSVGAGLPIYKTSDPVGLFGVADTGSGPCRNADNSPALKPWPSSGCGIPAFSDGSGKLIMHFRAGSGTVDTEQEIDFHLDVPAGVYPTTYTGVLIVEKVTTP